MKVSIVSILQKGLHNYLCIYIYYIHIIINYIICMYTYIITVSMFICTYIYIYICSIYFNPVAQWLSG